MLLICCLLTLTVAAVSRVESRYVDVLQKDASVETLRTHEPVLRDIQNNVTWRPENEHTSTAFPVASITWTSQQTANLSLSTVDLERKHFDGNSSKSTAAAAAGSKVNHTDKDNVEPPRRRLPRLLGLHEIPQYAHINMQKNAVEPAKSDDIGTDKFSKLWSQQHQQQQPGRVGPFLHRVKRLLAEGGLWLKNWLTNNYTLPVESATSIFGSYSVDEIRADFNNYYACMENRKSYFESYATQPTKMIDVQQIKTERVSFECKACRLTLLPAQRNGITWMRRLFSTGKGYEEIPAEPRFDVNPSGSLSVSELTEDDVGIYACFKNSFEETVYVLGVEMMEAYKQVYEDPKSGPGPTPDVTLLENNLFIYTIWKPWTRCTTCNIRGIRTRIGDCKVRKLNSQSPITPRDVFLLNSYPELDCHSPLLPRWLALLPALRLRQSERVLGYCFENCTGESVLEQVFFEQGNVKNPENTNVDAGTVQVLKRGPNDMNAKESKPVTPPPVEKDILFVDYGHKLVLSCPSDKKSRVRSKVPPSWTNGSELIDEVTVQQNTQGRVFIDPVGSLVIRKAYTSDTGLYCCWSGSIRRAAFKIHVQGYDHLDFGLLISKAGLYLLLITVAIVVVRVSYLACREPLAVM